MARRRRLVDVPTHPLTAPCITAPAPAVRVALWLAGGDARRLSVVPSPGAVGGGAVLVRNHPRGRS
jgi:hypothetical protein